MSNVRLHLDPHNLHTPSQFAAWRRCQEILAAAPMVGGPHHYCVTPFATRERVEMVTPLETGAYLYRRYDMVKS